MHATAEIDTRTRENAHERSWSRHANTDNCTRAQDVTTITLQPPNVFVYRVSSASATRAFLTGYGAVPSIVEQVRTVQSLDGGSFSLVHPLKVNDVSLC